MSIVSPPLCMFYNSKQGCRNGNHCKFHHSKPTQVGVTQKNPATRPAVASIESKSTLKLNESHTNPQKLHPLPIPVESLWESSCDAALSNQSGPQYADIVKSNLTNDEYQDRDHVTENYYNHRSNKIPEVCSFFLAGHCKFGNRCRYLHASEEEGLNGTVESIFPPVSSSNNEDEQMECGICLEPPKGSLYGLLSHCSCKFCLSCIRNWRSDGISVTKDQKQVRICPLCRTVSYFVVPSQQFLSEGPQKNALLEAYKKSIEKKPCKYYHQDGHCPFGSSCFYMHEVDGSKGTEKTHRNAGLQTIANVIDIDSLIRNRRNNNRNNDTSIGNMHENDSRQVDSYNDVRNEDDEAAFEEFLAVTEGLQNLSYEETTV